MAILGDEFCFLENFTHTIDSQRRFAIPSEWRQKDVDTQFVLLPAKNQVIQAIPLKTFQDEILAKAKKMSLADSKAMRDLMILASRAMKCSCDKQGRIQVNQKLMEHAGLTDKAVLVGSLWLIQIVSPENWEKIESNGDDGFFDVMQRINDTPDDLAGVLKGITQ